eukprot:11558451-Alexandrium_andersonii.AAC.1
MRQRTARALKFGIPWSPKVTGTPSRFWKLVPEYIPRRRAEAWRWGSTNEELQDVALKLVTGSLSNTTTHSTRTCDPSSEQ